MPPAPDTVMAPLTRRQNWMGHPAFFVCIAVLVVNDHVLKDLYPGWWTGKISDFAGVAVVAIILSAGLGTKFGLTLTAGAFAALKLLSGVAEAAAPVLGGVTRRDATDLLALTVLVPIWIWQRPGRHCVGPATGVDGMGQGIRSRPRTLLATAASITGLVFATFATTATSCMPAPAIVVVEADGPDLLAFVTSSEQWGRWAKSSDDGRTWRFVGRPGAPLEPTDPDVAPGGPIPSGAQETCTADGTCWRVQDQRSIFRVDPAGATTQEFGLAEHEFEQISTGCHDGSAGVLASITSVEVDSTPRVFASLGADGILVRRADSRWDPVKFTDPPPPGARTAWSHVLTVGFLFTPALAFIAPLVRRRRWPSWRRALALVPAGWAAAVFTAVGTAFWLGSSVDGTTTIRLLMVLGAALVTLIAIRIARRPAKPPEWTTFPPPVARH